MHVDGAARAIFRPVTDLRAVLWQLLAEIDASTPLGGGDAADAYQMAWMVAAACSPKRNGPLCCLLAPDDG